MVRRGVAVLLLLLSGAAWAEEAEAAGEAEEVELVEAPEAPRAAVAGRPRALPGGWSAPVADAPGVSPGREEPKRSAPEGAIEVLWEEYRTLLVVGPGAGLIRPAWVLTYAAEEGGLVVAYRGFAFRDAKGVLHVDARNALIVGPMAENWRADSFAVYADGEVRTLDDQGSAQQGHVQRVVPAQAGEFPPLQQQAEALVSDTG